jgi:hypothetical protein
MSLNKDKIPRKIAPKSDSETVGKKRGRKPKGGKIINQQNIQETEKVVKPNVILHLKCSVKDLTTTGQHNSNFSNSNIDPYNFDSNKTEYKLDDFEIEQQNINTHIITEKQEKETVDTREIWKKMKTLEHNLHNNNISDKKSACFWCTFDFDNPSIYIPKNQIKDTYRVYGCFCSPECATAYLMNENLDTSIKFERYALLNHIYSKIYEYKKNIKPAPNPFYMLDKYYGNLSIQEYRSLLKSYRLYLMIDKPITRILPEYYEDNDDFIINHKVIPSNNLQVKRNIKNQFLQNQNEVF